MINIFDLSDYLLYLGKEKSKVDGEEATSDITPLKLQKLLYYCQAYSLGLYGEILFSNIIEAWEHGPVVPEIYNKYKSHKASIAFLRDCREIKLTLFGMKLSVRVGTSDILSTLNSDDS